MSASARQGFVGREGDLADALDTPRPDEAVVNVADRWLSALATEEQPAPDLIEQFAAMIVGESGR